MGKFVGRKEELKRLHLLSKKRVASFVVIRGRRRIGKSRLIEEFGKDHSCHIITGLPSSQRLTKQTQLDEFCSQVADSFRVPRFTASDWGQAFQILAHHSSKGRIVIALDEISWMGSRDSRFLAHLKNAWDRFLSKNSELIFIVCGSVSSWIEKNILSHTGFLGRISLDIVLTELSLAESARFWEGSGEIHPQEICKVLAVTGGVPRYLEEITPELTAEENIRMQCFSSGGLLFREFSNIFSDLFSSEGTTYANLLDYLSGGSKTFDSIQTHLRVDRKATISDLLQNLRQAGFITEDPTWNLRSQKQSTLRRYRLSDNYIRFYLRYVRPREQSILKGRFRCKALSNLPGWEAVMGLQFENLVLNNVPSLFDQLSLDPFDILHYGPFFQRRTTRQEGCQIDLLIQTAHSGLFICEMKSSSTPIGIEAAHSLAQKKERLFVPSGYSTRSVLIHLNGVTPELKRSKAYQHFIDFGQLLVS